MWVQHGGESVPGQAQYADLNGDGRTDLIYQGMDNKFWVSFSTGTGFTPPAMWVQHGGSFIAGQAQYGDLNGDGKADLIYQGTDNKFWVSLSTGTGFTPPAMWVQHGGTFQRQAQYGDLNGDGKIDLIFQGGGTQFWVSLSTGTGFTPPAMWVQQAGRAKLADLNGDGNADLILEAFSLANPTSNSYSRFWVSFSTGFGFTSPAMWVQYNGVSEEGQAQFADVSGDGMADLIHQGYLDNKLMVYLSTVQGSGQNTIPNLLVTLGNV
jgi:hypothetical protein